MANTESPLVLKHAFRNIVFQCCMTNTDSPLVLKHSYSIPVLQGGHWFPAGLEACFYEHCIPVLQGGHSFPADLQLHMQVLFFLLSISYKACVGMFHLTAVQHFGDRLLERRIRLSLLEGDDHYEGKQPVYCWIPAEVIQLHQLPTSLATPLTIGLNEIVYTRRSPKPAKLVWPNLFKLTKCSLR